MNYISSLNVNKILWLKELGECFEYKGCGISSVYRKIAAEHRNLKKLKWNQSVYRMCANVLCVRPEHLAISKKGKTTWIHLNKDIYWRRYRFMRENGRTNLKPRPKSFANGNWKSSEMSFSEDEISSHFMAIRDELVCQTRE